MLRPDVVFACVLRTGGDFEPEHAVALEAGLDEHLSYTVPRVCLTDVPNSVLEAGWRGEVAVLGRFWTGWWSKVELFGPDTFERYDRVVYADLDTVFVGGLDDVFAYDGAFAMLSDFNREDRAQSGLMSWRPTEETARIYENYARDPAGAGRASPRGDGQWIESEIHRAGIEEDRWQDLLPGQVVSYKAHVRGRKYGKRGGDGTVPEGARVVCYHGQPRPWAEPLPR